MRTAPPHSAPQALAFDLPDRMRRALKISGIAAQDMATELGVTPSSVSRWLGGRGAPPKRSFLIAWSSITGVPLEWLETGQAPGEPAAPPSMPAAG